MTLNQLVQKITTYANNHEQIKFVYFGDVWDRLSNGEVSYPAIFFGGMCLIVLWIQDFFTHQKIFVRNF